MRSIGAMATSSDCRWIAVAEFMTGGCGPQVRGRGEGGLEGGAQEEAAGEEGEG